MQFPPVEKFGFYVNWLKSKRVKFNTKMKKCRIDFQIQ